jgi:hypothetical protein
VTNIYAPFLLTKLLLPILRETARTEKSAPGTVRVSWAGSSASFMSRPHAGLAWTPDNKDLVYAIDNPQMAYAISKAANFYLGVEFGHRYGDDDGVLHDVSLFPQITILLLEQTCLTIHRATIQAISAANSSVTCPAFLSG